MGCANREPAHERVDRPLPSRALATVERAGRAAESRLAPGERMARAFELSRDLRLMFEAGLRAQGFSDTEIDSAYRTGRR